MEGYQEKRQRKQDALMPEGDDTLTKNFRELIICARCVGRYIKGGYRETYLDLPPDFIPGEEAVTERLIRYLLAEGRKLHLTVGDEPLLRMDTSGIFRSEEWLLIEKIVEDSAMPWVGNSLDGFISVEDFCANLYFDGTVELV